jgi:cystathionine beta-lyase
MTCDFDRIVERRHTDSLKWDVFAEDILPLWVADMDFPAPEAVTRALRERIDHGILGYGRIPAGLREVIVERLERLYSWRVGPEALIFTAGVVNGFNQACHAIAEPGAGVVMQTPVYPPFLTAPGNAGMARDEMELTRQPDGRYVIDLDAFEAAITDRTRLFLLCSPHNPVSRVFDRRELEQMAEICLHRNLVICSDEIHCDLIFDGYQHIPIAALSPEIEARTITLLAPSKTFNIPGLHCSVAIIPDAGLRKRYQAAHKGLASHVNVLGFVAALAAYRDGQPWLQACLRYLQANRDYLAGFVRERLPGIGISPVEGTYLAWLDCRNAGIAGNPQKFFLEKAKVALNDGPSFGRGGEGFVRLNFGCPRAVLTQALERMARALA